MNALLWIVQVPLAFLYLAGGTYKIFSFNELATMPATAALSRGGWAALGAVEIAGAILLVAPAAIRRMPALTPAAAAALAVETLGLAALYSQYSLQLAATNPMVWAIVMGLLAAFVAYGRCAITPAVAAAP